MEPGCRVWAPETLNTMPMSPRRGGRWWLLMAPLIASWPSLRRQSSGWAVIGLPPVPSVGGVPPIGGWAMAGTLVG